MKIYKLETPKKRIVFTLICFLIIYLLMLLYVFLVNKYNFGIPCLFHEITGYYCPGCGITRAVMALMKLNIVEAFRSNAFVISLLPFLILYYGDRIIAWIKSKKPMFAHKTPNYIWYILIGLAIAFGILRNIPYFDVLAPLGN